MAAGGPAAETAAGPDPSRARLSRMGRNLLIGLGITAACLTLAIVAVLAGVLDGDDDPTPFAPGVRLEGLEEATCADWLELDRRERLTITVDVLREIADAGEGLARPRVAEAEVTEACQGRRDAPLLDVIDEIDLRAAVPAG